MLEKEELAADMAAGLESQEQARPGLLRARNPLIAGGWSTASFILSSLLGALLFIPLARLLNPEDFGLYAEATIVYSGLTVVIEFTLIRMLVRAPGDLNEMAQATLWLSTIAGVIGAILCGLAGIVVAEIYNDQRLVWMLVLLGPGILASALGAVPHALLSRELNFQRRLLPDTISVALAAVIALGAAFLGLGLYTLVLYPVLRVSFNALIAWIVVQWRPTRAAPRPEAIRRLLAFGLPTIGGELTLYARFNVDYAIGGRFLGASTLGVYSLAWSTAERPASLINSFFKDVGYATFARLGPNSARLQQVFLSATRLIATLALPGFLTAVLLRQELVMVIFGPRWQNAIEPLLPLFILQALWVIFYPSTSLVLALGHSRLYAITNTASLILTTLAVLVGASRGLNELAWAMLISAGLTSIFWGIIAWRYLRPGLPELWSTARLPVLFTIVTLVAVEIGQLVCAGTSNLLRLLVAGIAGIVVMALCLRLGWPVLKQDLATLREKLPEEKLG